MPTTTEWLSVLKKRKLKVTFKMIHDVCFAKEDMGGQGLAPWKKIETGISTRTIYVPKKMSVDMLRLFSDQNLSDFCLLSNPTILTYA